MATWTTITDSALDPGKPIRSVDGLALRDNPIAIAEGASGAPRIVNNAVTNGTLGSEKFQTGTAERDWVLARTAGASSGVVGSYALMSWDGLTAIQSPGTTVAGSSLQFASVKDDGTTTTVEVGDTPSGTWRLMGYIAGGGAGDKNASIFLRIS